MDPIFFHIVYFCFVFENWGHVTQPVHAGICLTSSTKWQVNYHKVCDPFLGHETPVLDYVKQIIQKWCIAYFTFKKNKTE